MHDFETLCTLAYSIVRGSRASLVVSLTDPCSHPQDSGAEQDRKKADQGQVVLCNVLLCGRVLVQFSC